MILVDTVCPSCKAKQIDLYIEAGHYPLCECGAQTERLWSFRGSLRKDSIEGGLVIHHGLCNEDGSPRTYYSQSEIDRECAKRGLMRWTDVYTEDKTRDARERADWLQSSEAKRAKRDRDEARRAGVRI